MSSVNPPWQRDELILALDLYFRHNPNQISQKHEEVIALSEMLNLLPIHQERPDKEKFRNPNGVYMKLCNFLACDPGYKGKGLNRGGKLEQQIWNEFASNPSYLHKVAQSITKGLENTDSVNSCIDEEEELFPEGKILYREHRSRERNNAAVNKAKRLALANNSLKCKVCGFDFYLVYGEIGKGFIECHHAVPVSEYTDGMMTKASDLVLVCSNCHRMLHRKRPWLTVEELKYLIENKVG